MKKALTAYLLALLIVSLGVAVLGGSEAVCLWPNVGGNSGRQAYCAQTVHPPYLSNWEVTISQGHHILTSNDYIFTICANEAVVFHTNSKEELGTFKITGPCVPVIFNDLFISFDGKEITARRISSDSVVWNVEVDDPQSLLASDRSLFINSKSHIYRADTNGIIQSSGELPDEPVSAPTVVGNRVVIACRDMRVHVFDAESLELVCSSATVGFVESVTSISDNSFVAVLERGGCIALAVEDCRQLWSDKTPTGKNKGAVTDCKWVYLFGSDSGILCKSIEGDTSWMNKTLSPTNISVCGRIILCCTRNSQIIPVQKSTGSAYNAINTPGDITSQAVPHKADFYVTCGPKLIRYSTSPFGLYLGISCDLNFGIICPEKIYTREIRLVNLGSSPISARVHTYARNTSTDKREIVVYPGYTETVAVSVNSKGVLSLQDFGEIVVDTPNYRYKLGINFFIKQIMGDCNLDCRVDGTDLIIIATHLGKRSFNPGFKLECDFDNNGIIDLNDVFVVRNNFGESRE
ncbi:MAG TPA: PQQ-binding-like beta-propeller repeat protein [Caldisericia bacterium]|nr:PQQ-binding-like beta-propeller repeat protein [Caldisericia bacterium]HPF49711.1 PQQ-binding-like beta-propeller repeat protein [Caldisericia bacterium]HPI84580.1 PQQ-binding-like beta-propeller repeat protein [Caldisericia bacterium]HPQ93416.1 PQQ-binding-like beta-propeller repeat protein [Caldisericia bacterium]HRV74876.1 PQQ-binding-like beta-propeller repeat protein [Caldisericia bacterium]